MALMRSVLFIVVGSWVLKTKECELKWLYSLFKANRKGCVGH